MEEDTSDLLVLHPVITEEPEIISIVTFLIGEAFHGSTHD
jgi:hypothetical protein